MVNDSLYEARLNDVLGKVGRLRKDENRGVVRF
jgi:hypothetical protein